MPSPLVARAGRRRPRAVVSVAAPLALALAAAGCLPLTVDDAYREALPDEDGLAIRIGQSDTASGALSSALLDPNADCPDCCVAGEGDAAAYVTGDLYKATRAAVGNVNGSLAAVFAWVRSILVYPYSSRSGDAFTWGPWDQTDVDPLSRLSFRFTMSKDATGTYAFRLEARNVNAASDPWQAVASGTVTPGGEAHRGAGTLDLDFDLLHALDAANPTRQHGKAHYEFDTSNPSPTVEAPNTVSVAFTDFWEQPAWGAPPPVPLQATYRYWRYQDLAGRFTFAVTADIVGPDDAPDGIADHLDVEAEWTAAGKGLASATVQTAAEPGFTAYRVDECWADRAGLYYQTFRKDTATPVSGAPFEHVLCGAQASCPSF